MNSDLYLDYCNNKKVDFTSDAKFGPSVKVVAVMTVSFPHCIFLFVIS